MENNITPMSEFDIKVEKVKKLESLGEKAYKIGYVTKGEGIQINLK